MLFLPRIILGVHERQRPRPYAMHLDLGSLLRVGVVRRLRLHDGDVAGFQPGAPARLEFLAEAHEELSADHRDVLDGGMEVRRDPVVRRELEPQDEGLRLVERSFDDGELRARLRRRVVPFQVFGRREGMSVRRVLRCGHAGKKRGNKRGGYDAGNDRLFHDAFL